MKKTTEDLLTSKSLELPEGFSFSDFYIDLTSRLEETINLPLFEGIPNEATSFEWTVRTQYDALRKKNAVFCNEKLLASETLLSFFNMEEKNARTNNLFCGSKVGETPLLRKARRFVARVIGSSPTWSVDGLLNYGPGTSTSFKGADVNQLTKAQRGTVAITAAARPFWEHFTRNTPYQEKSLRMVEYNTFGTVPKSSTSLRTICVENEGNMLLQRQAGNMLRRRLQKIGLDLDVQHLVHKSVMQDASCTKVLCTIDLRNASNSISTNVVKALLPPLWFDFLDKIRSHSTKYPDRSIKRTEMFSSMGNGFTFELETLIFLAIVHATTGMSEILQPNKLGISVFGDDIIAPDEYYHDIKTSMEYFGFELNSEKSFHGIDAIRESCGADYHNGISFTPMYLRYANDNLDDLTVLYHLLNQIYIMSLRIFNAPPYSTRFGKPYGLVLDLIPKHLRYYGPIHYVGEMLTSAWICREGELGNVRHGIRYVTGLKLIAQEKPLFNGRLSDYSGNWLYILLEGSSHGATIRRSIKGTKVKTFPLTIQATPLSAVNTLTAGKANSLIDKSLKFKVRVR